jgi:hypothetical protein
MSSTHYHLIVYVPLTHAEAVREALARAGAGKIGQYDSCSFSCRGTGRFRPLEGASPAIGRAGMLEEVREERIETVVPSDASLEEILRAVKDAHPYEEPAIHLLPMTNYKEFLQ